MTDKPNFNDDLSAGMILAGEIAAIAVLCLVAFAIAVL